MTTYRYMSIMDSSEGLVMTVMYIYEPPLIEYIKSLFGLLAPWPTVKEYEVKFIQEGNYWIEYTSKMPVSNELSYILMLFKNHAKSNPFGQMYGII